MTGGRLSFGTVLAYLYSDPSTGHGLMAETHEPRREMFGARIGLTATIVGFVVSVVAALIA